MFCIYAALSAIAGEALPKNTTSNLTMKDKQNYKLLKRQLCL
jgi:hypothetical protein